MVSVYTVGEICKKCYSCVRSCPTKALQVRGGQAEIIEDFCISCGYCVNVCSQGAKRVISSLGGGARPSLARRAGSMPSSPRRSPRRSSTFPPSGSWARCTPLGFDGVYEVAFGADLVSYEYYKRFRALLERDPDNFLISTPCPAVVQYVEKMLPELAPHLAPHRLPHGGHRARGEADSSTRDAKVVFIGPCVAKKVEALARGRRGRRAHLRRAGELFADATVDPRSAAAAAEFRPPHANLGRIYPVTGGLLKAAAIDADILESPVYVVEGQERVMEILRVLSKRVKSGERVHYRLFDLLFCEGCIGGPVMVNDLTFYRAQEVRRALHGEAALHAATSRSGPSSTRDYLDVDLSQELPPRRARGGGRPRGGDPQILALTGKNSPSDELNCGACGYSSCREKAMAVYRGKAEVEMCLPYLISRIEKAMKDLTENQARLIQAEKLASMGQMAAGIAHEINNPLGVVLMYSHLLKEELAASTKGGEDVERIIAEAERTRGIVRGILNFAREEKVERAPTDINALVQNAASGILGTSPNGKIRVEFQLDPSLGQPVGGRGAAPPGLRQPVEERGGGHARWGHHPGHHRGRRRGVRRHDLGHRSGNPGRKPAEDVLALLHDEEGREGHGPRALGLLRHREDARGRHPGVEQADGGGACFTVRIRHHAALARDA